jgi:hypothetical protein
MNFRKAWPVVVVAGLILVATTWSGCSGSNSSNGNGSSGSGSGGTNGPGICEPTCNKACGVDNDCDTSNGELCCDYGTNGKVCQDAKSCPRFCTDDSACNTTMGQACELVSLSSTEKACETPTQAFKLCQADSDCMPNNEVCCTIYNKGICTAANECPKACSTSSTCDTTSGEVCCTTVQKIEPSLTTAGLCLNPAFTPCPKACSTSSDCDNPQAAICCNGVCAATCPKSCMQSSDCTGQICCKTSTASLPPPPVVFKVGPTCQGTPTYTTCQQCGQSFGCSRCGGCSSEGGTGACTGTPFENTCAACGQVYNCATQCLGCTAGTGTGTCTGNAYPCSDWDGDPTGCAADLGCSYPDGGTTCIGTPTACTTFTDSTSCGAQAPCTWQTGTTSCTGNLTPCNQLGSANCSQQYGCSYNSGVVACDGTLTPCSQLPANMCTTPGCSVQ